MEYKPTRTAFWDCLQYPVPPSKAHAYEYSFRYRIRPVLQAVPIKRQNGLPGGTLTIACVLSGMDRNLPNRVWR